MGEPGTAKTLRLSSERGECQCQSSVSTLLMMLCHRRIIDGAIPLTIAALSFVILVGSFALRRLQKWLRRRRHRKRVMLPVIAGIDDHDHGNGHGLPALLVETGYEHDANDSHDAMLEAENAVIRDSVKRQGIVWPEAFKALGLLKEKEDHHKKPDLRKSRYLQVLEDGHDHASDSWIQWWKAGQRDMRRVQRWKRRWRKVKIKKVLERTLKHGKRNFIQSNAAWAIVAVTFVKAYQNPSPSVWLYTLSIVWVRHRYS